MAIFVGIDCLLTDGCSPAVTCVTPLLIEENISFVLPEAGKTLAAIVLFIYIGREHFNHRMVSWAGTNSETHMTLKRALGLLVRGLRLRCPRCGAKTLFRKGFAMHDNCRVCAYRFEREQGYYVGAMYINYGVTVLIIVPGYFALEWWTEFTLGQQLALWSGVGILLPLVFFRHARGLWLGFDYIFNPDEGD